MCHLSSVRCSRRSRLRSTSDLPTSPCWRSCEAGAETRKRIYRSIVSRFDTLARHIWMEKRSSHLPGQAQDTHTHTYSDRRMHAVIKPEGTCVLSFLCLPGSPLLRRVSFLGFRLSFRTVPKGFAILSAVVGIALLIYSGIAALGYVHWTDTLCPQVRAVRPIKLSAGCCYPFSPIKLSAD